MIPASRRAAICLKLFVPPQSGAPVVGRGHDSDALAFEEGTELLSRETVCPRGVTDLFETVKYVVKSDSNKSRDVFSNDPVGVELVDDAQHFRPQVSVVFFASLFPRNGERLTRESTRDNGGTAAVCSLIETLFR